MVFLKGIAQAKEMIHHVVLLLLGAHLASAGTHSLRYVYTGVSGLSDFPEFTAVGLVDEGQFMYFDSNIMKAVPKTEWIRQSEGADYWDRETQIDIGHHQTFKVDIQTIKGRFNQTTGIHTVQNMYGCELDDDGTKRGYDQFGYDGEDFLSLDLSSLTWTAAKDQAVATKVKWDSTGAFANQDKAYLENICIESLQKYVRYGKDTLERKVSPQVSVLKRSSSSSVKCHATGFYPKEVTISWMKNGKDHDEDVEVGQVLPNEDGTFQKMSELRVSPEEWKKNEFICVVEHQGETIREILKDDSPIGIIVGVVVAVVLLLAVIGVVVFKVLQKKKKPDFTPVNGSDDGSNRS
ncbi:H-2 class I histocompatibility antigen, Q9 alpha chain-like [Carassius auratus]|uniref:H-2 class I histocompatibility antigen, Q9 alpha chain-like n=1 Tax=Carassius auratus TaxID=7957 RepID=A0A6P6PKS1_CARAU|nr:H-2 class I histocompatibility antigen, Q9 alpha chain-like [Carassius auratus]